MDGKATDAAAHASPNPALDASLGDAPPSAVIPTFDGGRCPASLPSMYGETECAPPQYGLECVYGGGGGCGVVFTCPCNVGSAACRWTRVYLGCLMKPDAATDGPDAGGLVGLVSQEIGACGAFPALTPVPFSREQTEGCGNSAGRPDIPPVSIINNEEELAEAQADHPCLGPGAGIGEKVSFDKQRLIVIGVQGMVTYLGEIEDALVVGLQTAQGRGTSGSRFGFPVLTVPKSDKPILVRSCDSSVPCNGACPP